MPQLKALRANDGDALRLTFGADAVVLGFASDKPANALVVSDIVFDRIVNGPGEITKAKIASIIAGGDAKTMWWTAEVALSRTSPACAAGAIERHAVVQGWYA